MRPVPVLMYHHVNPHKGDMVTITPEVFEGQMKYLREAGYKTLKIEELVSYIRGESALNQKAVAVTFDDGWLDNYIYAFPILKKYGINAAIFIITDSIERASLRNEENSPSSVPDHKESKMLIEKKEDYRVALNWRLIREMGDSGLVEFYSHTKSHRKCNDLSENELLEEIEKSKKIIEEKMGRPCPYLCWPYGKYNDAALNIAANTGYKAIFTTGHGVVETGSDPLAIKRIVVKDSVAWFKNKMVIYTNSFFSRLYLMFREKF